MRIPMTKPRQVRGGYTASIVADDGRTLVASSIPKATRNAAITEAWIVGRWYAPLPFHDPSVHAKWK